MGDGGGAPIRVFACAWLRDRHGLLRRPWEGGTQREAGWRGEGERKKERRVGQGREGREGERESRAGQGRAGPGRKGREGGWEGGRPLPARPRSGRLAARPCSSPSPVAYLRRAGALLGVIRSEEREEEREGGREEGSQPPAQPREQTALVGKEGLEAVGSAGGGACWAAGAVLPAPGAALPSPSPSRLRRDRGREGGRRKGVFPLFAVG